MAGKIRIGLVGAAASGTWSSRSHLPALTASADFELAAVCTTKAASAEAARQAHGARLAFDDFRKIAASPEIDAVSVVVRVPSHYEPVKAALEAGKHVLCEWPLGRTTAEAEELAALARAKGVTTAVGLQARQHPTLLRMKELIAEGFVGRVMAVHARVFRDGVLGRPANRMWQRDGSLGAHTLTIPAGHTIDAMIFVVGAGFGSLSAVVGTQQKQWLDTDANKPFDVTSPDNVLVSGRLANGAVVSVHVASVPYAGSNYCMEIYGSEGTLTVSGPESPQWTELVMKGTRGSNTLEELPVPDRLRTASAGTPAGIPYNVGQVYARFAEAIRGEGARQPTFDMAVDLHRLIDKISDASRTGRQVSVG